MRARARRADPGAGRRRGGGGDDRLWRGLTLLVLLGGWAAAVALNAPGHLSYDSVLQLLDGRTGRYHTWHPPFMAWLLGLADAGVRGTGLYIALQAAGLFAALALFVVHARPVRPWAPLAAAALCAAPLVLLWQGIVWKDVLFADLLVAGFALLSVSPGRDGGPRCVPAVIGMALLGAAALVRQNGLLAPMGGAVFLGWALARTAPSRWQAALVAAAALALTLAAVAGAGAALASRSLDGDGAGGQLRSLHVYDLAGALARDPRLPLARLPPAVAADFRRAAPRLYTPLRIDPIQGAPQFEAWTADDAAWTAQWRELLLRRPDLWLRHRADVFRALVAPPPGVCLSDFTGVDGDPAMMRTLGLAPGWRPRDLQLARYAARFHGTPLYAHWACALVAAGLAAWLVRSRRPADLAVAVMLLTALAFAASFAVIGVACDHRYLYALDLAALAALFRQAAGPAAHRLSDATRARG